jgi:ABC-2 type transport system ATP-binding protein
VTTTAIQADGLRKMFGDAVGVDSVDLSVPAGSVYGFLGPNGAGKTTTIRMLATLVRPTGGRARVFGHDVESEPAAVRARIGLTGQFASVDDDLTGVENLVLMGLLRGLRRRAATSRARDLLAIVGLEDAAGRLVRTYSGGMRRRVDIAASVVVPPALLFLDEPTTGLDPRSREQVWDVVRALTAAGTTVLLTTQYLEEADRLADRLAVIDGGRIIAEGPPSELKRSVGGGVLRVRVRDAERRADAERLLGDALAVPVERGDDPISLSAPVTNPGHAGVAVTRLADAGIDLVDVGVGQPSLDEVFLALTGRHAAGVAAEETAA